jgi:hypothetical protein
LATGWVNPATTTLPELSTAISVPPSLWLAAPLIRWSQSMLPVAAANLRVRKSWKPVEGPTDPVVKAFPAASKARSSACEVEPPGTVCRRSHRTVPSAAEYLITPARPPVEPATSTLSEASTSTA